MKFKVGDRVKSVKAHMDNWNGAKNPLRDIRMGHLGTVVEVSDPDISFPYEIQFDGLDVLWPMDEDELEVV